MGGKTESLTIIRFSLTISRFPCQYLGFLQIPQGMDQEIILNKVIYQISLSFHSSVRIKTIIDNPLFYHFRNLVTFTYQKPEEIVVILPSQIVPWKV